MLTVYEQAFALVRNRRIPEAQRLLEQFLQDSPNEIQARYLLGVCLFRRKEFARAETCFRHLLTFDSGHVNGRYYLGLCLERQGQAEASRNEFRFVLALEPEHQLAREKVGISAQPILQSKTLSQQAAAGGGEPEVTSDPGVKIFDGHRKARTFVHVPVVIVLALLASAPLFSPTPSVDLSPAAAETLVYPTEPGSAGDRGMATPTRDLEGGGEQNRHHRSTCGMRSSIYSYVL